VDIGSDDQADGLKGAGRILSDFIVTVPITRIIAFRNALMYLVKNALRTLSFRPHG
jgi:hypothetical protein